MDLKNYLLHQTAEKAVFLLGAPDRDYTADGRPGSKATRYLRYYWDSGENKQKLAMVLDYDHYEKTMYKCVYLRITVINGLIVDIGGTFESY